MKVAALLKQRRENWLELDRLCGQMRRRKQAAETVTRFAELYRAACADLALADAYELPPSSVQYLHQLVGRAHNQLYRSRQFDYRTWGKTLLFEVPQRLFNDRCVQIAFVLFWTTFIGSALMAYHQADWAVQIMPPGMMNTLEESFREPIGDRDPQANLVMAAFYIRHNTGIGLRCFAWGILVVPGLFETLWNALVLGAAFGHMGRPDIPQGVNFFNFVTAHGPFELTAIVLSAGAGLRIGMGWLYTGGLTRMASLQKTAVEALPLMGVAMLLFFLAALIEGFLSPTSLPYPVKAGVGIVSSGILMLYFVILGFPRGRR
jgi:uncharacterized membrane protein SpoIIM required for sporulation